MILSLKKKLILFSNIDVGSYYNKSEIDDIGNELSTLTLNTYTKTEIDTQLTDHVTFSHLQGNYMTTLSITEALMNNYASITLLVDSFYSKGEINSTPNGYATSAQLHTGFYSKIKTNLIFDTYTTTTQLDDGFYSEIILIICF